MAVLHFDGADDRVRGDVVPGAWNGAFTIAAVVNHEAGTSDDAIFATHHDDGSFGWQFYCDATPTLKWYDDLAADITNGPSFTDGDDWLVVMTRASAASNTRFHIKNLTTEGAWAHSNGDGATASNPRSAASGHIKIGTADVTGIESNNNDFIGTISVVGFWDGVNMSDGQVEFLALEGLGSTDEWRQHAAGTPTFLTELNTSTPTDIGTAGLTLVVTGTTLTGTAHPGWTFTGNGAVRGFGGGDALDHGYIYLDDGGIGDLSTQAFTFVAVFSTDEDGGSDRPLVCTEVSSLGSAGMGRAGDGLGYYDVDEIAFPATGMGISLGLWHVGAMTKASGASAPRFHAKELGVGSWVHSTSATSVTASSGATEFFAIGAFQGAATTFNGRIAVAAIFLSVLSDGVIESIETNPTTEFLASLGPFALWEFNQADTADDVLDLIGTAHQTSVTRTYVETGDDPAWTFGLAEAGAEVAWWRA